MTDEDTLRLQAALLIQKSEIDVLLCLFSSLVKALELESKDVPTVSEQFASERKKLVQARLLSLEKAHPELAAKIQEILDSSSSKEFGYD